MDETGRRPLPTLFLIEDDDVDAHAVHRALRALDLGDPVVRARNGIEALEMLRRPGAVPRPCVILLDLNMPCMNGLEFLAALRADPDPALRRSVVFVLTTSAEPRERDAAYDLHAAGYIVKRDAREGFAPIVTMVDLYRQTVELPDDASR